MLRDKSTTIQSNNLNARQPPGYNRTAQHPRERRRGERERFVFVGRTIYIHKCRSSVLLIKLIRQIQVATTN